MVKQNILLKSLNKILNFSIEQIYKTPLSRIENDK